MDNKLLQASEKGLMTLDDRAKEFFAPYTDTTPVRALDLLSKLGDQPELRAIAGILLAFGTIASKDRLVRAGPECSWPTRLRRSSRTWLRPTSTALAREAPGKGGRGDRRRAITRRKKRPAFHPGHSAGAIAAARAFSREFPEYGAIAIGAGGAIAASQVLRCAHYPTDVAAGVLVGLVIEEVTNAAWDTLEMDERSTE